VDEEGRKLLGWFIQEGARLYARDCMNRCMIEELRRAHPSSKAHESMRNVSRQITKVMILTVALLACTGLRAEDPPALKLTLKEAVQTALKQNPQVLVANLNVATSREDATVARADLLPQAGLEVFEKKERFNLDAFIGGSFPGSPHHAGPFSVFQAGGALSMPVFDLALWRKWQASRQGIAGSQARELGVHVMLFELPFPKEIEATRTVQITRRIVHGRFADPTLWLPIDATGELRWLDGVHLDERSAMLVSRSIDGAIGRLLKSD